MKNFIVILLLLLINNNGFSQIFQYAKSVEANTGLTRERALALDASENSITIGSFSGTVDFDPGSGESMVTSVGNDDIFILKLDVSGNFVWVKTFGSTGQDQGMAVTVDAGGNIYSTGFFSGITDFDPSGAVHNVIPLGINNAFMLKLTNSGSFVWVKNMEGSDIYGQGASAKIAGYSIALDAGGNVHTTGTGNGWFDLNTGPDVQSIQSAKGTDDVFISKLDPNGNFLWGLVFGTYFNERPASLKVDSEGNVYSTGYFFGTVSFANGTPQNFALTSKGGSDAYVLKLNSSGKFAWAKNLGGTGNDAGNSLTLDGLSHVYTTGYFNGVADFAPGDSLYELTSAGKTDIYVSKLDTSGNFVAARSMGGTGDDSGNGIITDVFKRIFLTGSFEDEVNFDPDFERGILNSEGESDIFILRMNDELKLTAAKQLGGTGKDVGYSLAVTNSETIYSAGMYSGDVSFKLDNDIFNLSSIGASAMYVLKMFSTSLPVKLLSFETTKSASDALLTWKTSQESNSDKFEIERSTDGLVFSKIGEVKASGTSAAVRTYSYLDKNVGKKGNKRFYYRLALIDLDGKKTYSLIQFIDFGQAETSIRVYPNPVVNTIILQRDEVESGQLYTIRDLGGRKIRQGKLKGFVTKVDVSDLRSGMYLVEITGKNKSVLKILKQ